MACSVVSAQKKVDTTSSDRKYWKFVGSSLVDIRYATKEQLRFIAAKERLISIQKDRFLFSVGENLYGTYNTLGLRFENNKGATVYEGLPWNWGNREGLRRYLLDKPIGIEFANVNITPENAKDYRYHIVSNDEEEIVGWSVPDQFKRSVDGKSVYAYFGSFPAQVNGFLKIEIYNIHNYKERDGIIVDWRPVKPVKLSVGVLHVSGRGSSNLIYEDLYGDVFNGLTRKNFKLHEFFLGDSLVSLLISLDYGHNYGLETKLIRTINGKTEKLNLGTNSRTFSIYKEYWKEPGDYELILTPRLHHPGGNPVTYFKNMTVRYKFKVLPEKDVKHVFSNRDLITTGILVFTFFGVVIGGIMIWLKKKNKKKVQEEQREKEMAKIRLSAVRSQLNPHFMFNALAGIQSLMNQNKAEDANHYLGQFARLTRNVVKDQEMLSLSEEKALLQDYLEMEQLRFGFTFQINIDQGLGADNVEIPAMLLQPFLENSIKHGIIDKKSGGRIMISFFEQNQDLILKIEDNGEGFDATGNYEGLGLQLSKKRISLLNTIYQETPILLDINSGTEGTVITITLTQWL